MDDMIHKDLVSESQTIALAFSESGDRASIADEEILFADLATILKLHAFAYELCDYEDPVASRGVETDPSQQNHLGDKPDPCEDEDRRISAPFLPRHPSSPGRQGCFRWPLKKRCFSN
jgi:hypothetical protein